MKSEEETHPSETETTRRFRDLQQRVGEKAKNVSNVTDQYVHENAWKALVLAAVVGCVVGFLIGNRE